MGPLVAFYILLYCCQQKHLPPASVYITANQKKINYPHDSFVSNLKDSIRVYILNYACVVAAAVPKWWLYYFIPIGRQCRNNNNNMLKTKPE